MTDVKGYRVLTDEQKDLMNDLKIAEEGILRIIDKLTVMSGISPSIIDISMLTLGKRSIQVGFMWAVRSIAQPQRISLPEDEVVKNEQSNGGSVANQESGDKSSDSSNGG